MVEIRPEWNNVMENYVAIQKIIMNERRVKILLTLSKNAATWSELMTELDIRNPKLLHDHVSVLSSARLITKNDDGLYCLTGLGREFTAANLDLARKLGRLMIRGRNC